jgi:hypothetical protein
VAAAVHQVNTALTGTLRFGPKASPFALGTLALLLWNAFMPEQQSHLLGLFPAVEASAYKHVRLYITDTRETDYAGVGQLKLKSGSSFIATDCDSATTACQASSYWEGMKSYHPSKAFQSADYWYSNEESSSWLKISFSTAVTFDTYQLQPMSSETSARPKDFKLQVSNVASPNNGENHAHWTTLDTQSNECSSASATCGPFSLGCAPGRTGSTSSCTDCEPGKFKALTGSAACTDCAAGKYIK